MSIMLLVAVLPMNVRASCDDPVTTLEINDCAQQEFDKTEAELNRVWKQVMGYLDELADEPDAAAAKAQLRTAQRTWVDYREQDCQAVHTMHQSGSIRTLMYLGCKTSHADRRTRELSEWLAEG
ncbi:MAG: DUF1311 domain-containing protein [Ahniella sp.]|nr:DUF1311 domain-containing protein [Ahniella sp.]